MTEIAGFFLDPLRFEFMQRAFLAVLILGGISGVISAYIVTRGMAFLGDALAHSVLPGVAIAYVSGQTTASALLTAGLVAGIISALGIGFLTRGRRLQEDTAIGIIFTGALALGIAIISTTRNFSTDLQHILIGNILSITNDHLILMIIIGGGVLIMLGLFYKEFLVVSFDPTLAETLRLPMESLRLLLLSLIAAATVISLQAAGVTMVAALLVTPAATARFFTRRFHWMMVFSALIAGLCGIGGLYAAWYLDVAPSAAIVLMMTALFLLTFFFVPRQGYVWSLLGLTARKA